MKNTIPRTPFSTSLSRSARETELRIKNILSGPRKRPPVLFLALMFSICILCGNLVSCQMAQAEVPEGPDTSRQEPGMSEGMAADNWKDGFWFVLLGTGSFRSASDGERLDLQSVTRLFTEDQVPFQVESFTLCDLDGDGIPEAVLRVGEYAGYAVLRWEDGEVRAYAVVPRGLGELKADGTFIYSNSASDWGIGRYTFNGKESVLEEITYCKPAADYEIYMNRGEFISRSDFDLAFERWEASARPLWCELTEENIRAMLDAEGRFHVYELEDTESKNYRLTFVGQIVSRENHPQEVYGPIQLFVGDTLVQVITGDDPVQEEGYLFEGLLPWRRPDYRDVNFDGVPDLGLLCGGSYNGPVYWFLRNKETKQFEPGFYSSLELNVDDEKQILLDGWRDGMVGWDYYTYQYNDRGERVRIDHKWVGNPAAQR